MRSMCPAQRQVELRRFGNQLPVLGKANSLYKIVKCGVFFLIFKLRVLVPAAKDPGKKYPGLS